MIIIFIGDRAFKLSSVKSVTLVNGLTMLGLAMFANTGLKSITIPSTVTFIGTNSSLYFNITQKGIQPFMVALN